MSNICLICQKPSNILFATKAGYVCSQCSGVGTKVNGKLVPLGQSGIEPDNTSLHELMRRVGREA